jgi:hypothetical protein
VIQAVFLVTLLYVVLPGHPGLPFRGLPLGVLETAAFVMMVGLFLARDRQGGGSRVSPIPAVVLTVAVILKGLLAFAWYPTGWLARYYANEAFAAPIERSTELLLPPLRFLDGIATRINPAIEFRDSSFPVYFVNDARFARGARREVTEPFSVEWRGAFDGPDKLTLTFVLQTRGIAELFVDGSPRLRVESVVLDGEGRVEMMFTQGRHELSVRYSKPSNTEGFVRLGRFDAGATAVFTDPKVLPFQPAAWRRAVGGLLPAAGWMVHGAALLALFSCLGPRVRDWWRSLAADARADWRRAVTPAMTTAMLAGLVTQGVVRAWPFADRVVTLPVTDPTFTFESEARNLLMGGLSTSSHLTSYFVAAVHLFTGESLAGLVLIAFVLFAIAAVAVCQLTESLAGQAAAAVVLVVVIVLQQLAVDTSGVFPRPLNETLVVVIAAAVALAFVRLLRGTRARRLTSGKPTPT